MVQILRAGDPSSPEKSERDQHGPADSSRARTRPLVLGYLVVTAFWIAGFGLPVERTIILVWLFGLLAIAVSGDPQRLRGLARDWGLFAVMLLVYRYSAGLADSFGRPVTMDALVAIDEFLGFGTTPTERLQGWFPQDGAAAWWQVPLSFVYVSHFFVVLVAAALLWLRDRPAWIGYTKRLLTLAAAAVTTYVLFPAAPPWMAAEAGSIGAIERTPFLGWERIGLGFTAPLIESGRAVANPVAALPSMHAGFALFIAWFFWRRVGPAAKVALGAYAVSMAFTLVLTGEHWLADVALGWVYVATVMVVWQRLDPAPTDAEERATSLHGKAVAQF